MKSLASSQHVVLRSDCVYSPWPDPKCSGFLLRGQTWRSAGVSVNRGRRRTQEQHSKQQLLQRHWRLVGKRGDAAVGGYLIGGYLIGDVIGQQENRGWVRTHCEWTRRVILKWSQTSFASWLSSLEQGGSAFQHLCEIFTLFFLSWSMWRFFSEVGIIAQLCPSVTALTPHWRWSLPKISGNGKTWNVQKKKCLLSWGFYY